MTSISIRALNASYSDMEKFHDHDADRFADECEAGLPRVPLSPFYTFMFACQFGGVACNGGWAHALRCYSGELKLIDSMLANLGDTQLAILIHDCGTLIEKIMHEETEPDERGKAHEQIDKLINLEPDYLDPVSYTHLTLPTICSV